MPTREEILAAADRVIRECGVSKATTRLIAEAAHCSEGSLYNHFANKDELLGLAIQHHVAGHEGPATIAGLAGTGDVGSNLRAVVERVLEISERIVAMMPVMMADPSAMLARARAMDAAGHGPRKVIEAVADYLRREQEFGRVRPEAEVHGAATCLIGACFHQTMLAQVFGERLDRGTLAHRVVAALLPGLGVTDREEPQ